MDKEDKTTPEPEIASTDREVQWVVPPTEMEYDDSDGRGNRLLAHGTYRGLDFMVMDIRGSHMCGYVCVSRTDLDGVEDEFSSRLADIDCHGGVTYCGNGCHNVGGWWIGWDYAHYGDYVAAIHMTLADYDAEGLRYLFDGIKWTVADAVHECRNVIDQILDGPPKPVNEDGVE